MQANDNAGHLTPHGALGFFASVLAPTGAIVGQCIRVCRLNG